MTESYLAAAVNLHHECPRGFGASEHVLNYVHRQSPATGHILCMKGGAPRELKEISVLEEQMKQKERQLIDLAMKVRRLEEQVAALTEPVPVMTEYKEVDVLPIKRGPGRPRKNP